MKINKQEIKTNYLELLSIYREDIKTLEAEDRAEAVNYAKNYYNYLATANIPYANLALDVIEDRGKFGKLANIHLKHQSIFEGIKPNEIEAVREKIIIMLAYKDAKMRSSKEYHQSDPSYKKIEEYHKKVFESHSTPYAWGGLAPKVLVGSGSWMEYYIKDQGIFDGIKDIVKQNKIGKDSEYSVERMLQSVLHSYRIYSLKFDITFEPKIYISSQQHAAQIWKIDPNRVTEIKEDTSMFDSVSSKTFQIMPANHFYASRDPDYSSDSDSENEHTTSQTLGANQAINEQIKNLLSNPNEYNKYRQESINNALQGLSFAENLIPGITKASVNGVNENSELMQQLVGITNPNELLAKVQKSEQEIERMQPAITNLAKNINTKQTQEKASDDEGEDNNWLNDILSNTNLAMNNIADDPEMQQYLKSLGDNSGVDFSDNGRTI